MTVGERNIHEFTQLSVSAALRFLDSLELTPTEELIGAPGEILDDMEHEGWARVHSEQWRVRSTVPLKRGSAVRVRARHDLILDVEPDKENDHV